MNLTTNGQSGVAKVAASFITIFAMFIMGGIAFGITNTLAPNNLPLSVFDALLAATFTVLAIRHSKRTTLPANNVVDGSSKSSGKQADNTSPSTTKTPVSRPEPKPLSEKLVDDSGRSKVGYTTETLSDGSVKVVITAVGLSGREFKGPNGVREKVDRIKGAKFVADNNPTEKTRTLTATIKPGPHQADALTALTKLFGQPVSRK